MGTTVPPTGKGMRQWSHGVLVRWQTPMLRKLAPLVWRIFHFWIVGQIWRHHAAFYSQRLPCLIFELQKLSNTLCGLFITRSMVFRYSEKNENFEEICYKNVTAWREGINLKYIMIFVVKSVKILSLNIPGGFCTIPSGVWSPFPAPGWITP